MASNRPRYVSLSRMVGFVYIELSTISAFSVEGPALDSEPSAIHARNVDGSLLEYEPSVISVPSVEGSALDSEPSAIPALTVDGSTLVPEPSALRGCASLISCYTSNIKTWRKMPDPLGYDEKGSSQA